VFLQFLSPGTTCGHVPRRENLNKTKLIEIDVILLKNATNRRYKLCRNRRFPKRPSWNSQKRKVQDLVLYALGGPTGLAKRSGPGCPQSGPQSGPLNEPTSGGGSGESVTEGVCVCVCVCVEQTSLLLGGENN